MNTDTRIPRRASIAWLLLLGTLCAVLGLTMLEPAHRNTRHAAIADAPVTTPPSAAHAPSRPPKPTTAPSPSTSAPKPRPAASTTPPTDAIPVSGDGPSGDYAIQHVLERTSPANLPRVQEQQLVALASRIWLAEATGTGRDRWPAYFGDAPLRTPYRDVRIQAGIARTVGGNPDRARASLVWAGADPAGDEEDGRPAQVLFIRHNSAWLPIR